MRWIPIECCCGYTCLSRNFITARQTQHYLHLTNSITAAAVLCRLFVKVPRIRGKLLDMITILMIRAEPSIYRCDYISPVGASEPASLDAIDNFIYFSRDLLPASRCGLFVQCVF